MQQQAGNAAVTGALGRTGAQRATVQRATVQRSGGQPSGDSTTPLIDAARAGDAREVGKLLRKGAAVDQVDEFGATALIYAVDARRTDMVTMLLDAGGNPEIVSQEASNDGSRGDTAMKVAVINDDPATLTLLLARGARMDTRDGTSMHPPAWAAFKGSLRCLPVLLAHGWNIDAADPDGFTLLHWAALGGQVAAAQWLVTAGIDRSAVPGAITAAQRQIGAYEYRGAELSSRVISEQERPQLIADVKAITVKITALQGVVTYLRTLAPTPPETVAPTPAPDQQPAPNP